MRLWSLRRYRIPTSIALAGVAALCLAPFATLPAAAQTAAPSSTTAAPPVKTTKPAMSKADKKAAEQKRKADHHAANQADRAKQAEKAHAEYVADSTAGVPWIRGANWLSVRVGIAGAVKEGRPDPGPGVGFGYEHFLNHRWSTGFQADFDMLSKDGAASEFEAPIQLDLVRHFGWGDRFRPSLGLSAGGTYYRVYRTGADFSMVRPSFMVVTGGSLPIAPRSLVGIDFRFGWENDATTDNPVFPNGAPSLMTYRLKFSYLRWQ